jgi:hypothetical protein
MNKYTWSQTQDVQAFRAIRLLLKDVPYLLEYLFDHKKAELKAPASVLIKEAGAFSHGEQVLIKAAIDLWNSEGQCYFREIIDVLDYKNMLNFLNATCQVRDINEDLIDTLQRKLTLGHKCQ